jgi:DNA polymerase-3 subunit alpha
MKTYHPVEYMAAVLTFEMGSTDKVVEYIEECRRLTLPGGARGIKVLPPDVNGSDKDFTPIYVEPDDGAGATKKRQAKKAKAEKTGVIRFGLGAVRGVGDKAVETISAERQNRGDFVSLWDFCERIDLRQVTRATIEALVKCGAFSSTGGSRAQLLTVLERAVEMGQQSQQDKRAGQLSMFAPAADAGPISSGVTHALPNLPELADAELLKFEKELLGFYITSHPLTEHQSTIEHLATATTREVAGLREGTEAVIGGMICRVKKSITKNGRSAGQPMAMITLEDLDGQMDGVVFAENLAEIAGRYPNLVSNESIVFVRGKIDKRRETPSIVVSEMYPIDLAAGRLCTSVLLKLEPPRHGPDVVARIMSALGRHKGPTQVYAQVSLPDKRAILRLDRERSVRVRPELQADLVEILGDGQVDFCGEGTKRRKLVASQRQLFAEPVIAEADPAIELPMEADAEMDPAEDRR